MKSNTYSQRYRYVFHGFNCKGQNAKKLREAIWLQGWRTPLQFREVREIADKAFGWSVATTQSALTNLVKAGDVDKLSLVASS